MDFSSAFSAFAPVKGDPEWNGRTLSFRNNLVLSGFNLHYIDIGEGPPVVMVHGFSDSTYTFNNMAPFFSGLRLVLVDQPGLGRSGIPPETYEFSIENQAKAVLALMDHLGIERFYIVGHSMGGAIALYLSFAYPERVIKAAVIAPPSYSLTGFGFMSLPGIRFFAEQSAGKWLVELALKQVFHHERNITRAFLDESASFLEKSGYIGVLFDLFHDFFSPAFNHMTRNYDKLTTPLSVIWGRYDNWVPKTMGIRLQKEAENAVLHILDDTGHMVHLEKGKRVSRIVLSHFGLTEHEK